MGAKGHHIKKQVIGMLASTPGQYTCGICRQLNGISEITYCNDKSCYANSRKRATRDIKKTTCKYTLQLVRYHLQKFIKKGYLKQTKEWRTDNYQNRGYDKYTCYYPM